MATAAFQLANPMSLVTRAPESWKPSARTSRTLNQASTCPGPARHAVIQGFGETRLFAARRTLVAVSGTLGVLLGLAGGYLLGRLGLFPLRWTVPLGACAGLLGVLAVLGVHRQFRHGSGVSGQGSGVGENTPR